MFWKNHPQYFKINQQKSSDHCPMIWPEGPWKIPCFLISVHGWWILTESQWQRSAWPSCWYTRWCWGIGDKHLAWSTCAKLNFTSITIIVCLHSLPTELFAPSRNHSSSFITTASDQAGITGTFFLGFDPFPSVRHSQEPPTRKINDAATKSTIWDGYHVKRQTITLLTWITPHRQEQHQFYNHSFLVINQVQLTENYKPQRKL